MSHFQSNQSDQFQSNFTVTSAPNSGPETFTQGLPGGGGPGTGMGTITIGRNLQITGGSGANAVATLGTQANLVFVANLTVNGNMTVSTGTSTGTVPTTGVFPSVTFAPLANRVNLSAGNNTPTIINGNFTYTTTGGASYVSITGSQIHGNANLNLGTANTALFLYDIFVNPTIISGNLTVGDQGDLNTDPFGLGIGVEAPVGGIETFNLGNGTNTLIFDPSLFNPTSETIFINAGNGTNTVQFLNSEGVSVPVTYNVGVTLGNGTNNVTFNDPLNLLALTGSITAGGGGTNTFNYTPGQGVIQSPFTLQGF